ncbi:ubiquitin-specific protease ubp2 [Asimina triloba]
MGKKIKKKTRSAYKEKRISSSSTCSNSEHLNPTPKITDEKTLEAKGKKTCSHVDNSVDLDKITWNFSPPGNIKCDDCRDGTVVDRRPGKGKGKQARKKGVRSMDGKSEQKCLWVCLSCGHVACGGAIGDLTPQSHALRHSRQNRHPCAIQLDDPFLCWCFVCDSLLSVEKQEENGETNSILFQVQKLIKGQYMKGAVMDVEDVWFGTGNVEGHTSEVWESSTSRARGYRVRGLSNLGNTCFFNSVMQNLLAMDLLRTYVMDLDQSVEPLTMAFRKLFAETNVDADSKNGSNPKSLFGCICSKAPQFRGYQQQDSHELLRYLLDGLHTEELNTRKSLASTSEDGFASNTGSTFVDNIFGGQLSSTICCTECGHSSIVYEPFLDLSLPVPAKKSPPAKGTISQPKKKKLALKERNKGGKIRDSRNANVIPTSAQTATRDVNMQSECSESSSTLTSSAPDKEHAPLLEVVDILSHSDCIGPVTVKDQADALAVDDSLSWMDNIGPDTTKEPAASLGTEDAFSWLDYIEPNTAVNDVSSVSQSCDTSINHDSGCRPNAISIGPVTVKDQADALAVDDSLSWMDNIGPDTTNEPAASLGTEDAFSWLDYIEPNTAVNDVSSVSQSCDTSIIHDSGCRPNAISIGPVTVKDQADALAVDDSLSWMDNIGPDTTNEPAASLGTEDAFLWLDYIEPNTAVNDVSSVSQSCDTSIIHDSGCRPNAISIGPVTVKDQADALAVDDSLSWMDNIGPDTTNEPAASLGTEDAFSWLDYIEPNTTVNDVSSVSQSCDTSIIHDSGCRQGVQNENITQYDSEVSCVASSSNMESQDRMESYMENHSSDEIPLRIQDSQVLLLPYKEEVLTVEETERTTPYCQIPENIESRGTPVKDLSAAASSINGWDDAEQDFSGFGDLFNEPEIVSKPNDSSFQATDETEVALLTGNSSESNQEEIDNTNAPVSIDSCLAYFTKPELLSDEHAWLCESCSKSLKRQKLKAKKEEKKAVARDKEAKTCEQANDVKRNIHSTPVKNSEHLCQKFEKFDITSESAPQKLPSPAADESRCTAHEFGWSGNDMGSELLSNGVANHCKISEVGGYHGDTKHAPHERASVHDQTHCHATSVDCSENPCSTGNDSLSGGGEAQKQESSLLSGEQELDDGDTDEIDRQTEKVKRNASKRYLISKAPHILTIHLKRFSQDARGRLSKLCGHVCFTDTLDLWPYMDPRYYLKLS